MIITFFFVLAFICIIISLVSVIKLAKHIDELENDHRTIKIQVKHLEHKTRRNIGQGK
jgi:uncharacterized protein YoxC